MRNPPPLDPFVRFAAVDSKRRFMVIVLLIAIVGVVLDLVFMDERSSMTLLYRIPLGSALFTAIIAPLLYLLIFRPFTQLLGERERNTTALLGMNAKLSESEQRFRNMADASPSLIRIAGTDGWCTYFNAPWLRYTGRTMEQERGNGWTEGIHADDLERCRQEYGQAFREQRGFTIQYRLRKADGEYGWLFDTGTPCLTDSGAFTGYIGSCVEITEQKRAEQLLRQSKQQYDELVARIPFGIFILRMPSEGEFSFDFISPQTERILCMSAETLRTASHAIFDSVHPEESEILQELLRRNLTGRVPIDWTGRIVSSARQHWVHLSLTPEIIEQEDILWHGMVEDVTERRINEDALRESENRFRTLFESNTAMMLLIDPDGGAILDANKAAVAFYGYERSVLLRKQISDINALPPP